MKPLLLVLIALLVVVLLLRTLLMSSAETIEYQGQRIKLSRAFHDYDEYKNDPDNLATGEVQRVQQLVTNAPIANQFHSRLDVARAVGNIAFPGYGSGSHAVEAQPDGTSLDLWSVEIPKAGRTRYFLFRVRNGVYYLIDDFVHAEQPMIMQVRQAGAALVYAARDGTTIVERTPSSR
jgi:hypothetical protein